MKRLNIIMMVLLLTSVTACYRDLGNYDYQDINEITFEGIKGAYMVRSELDVLHIAPDIAMTKSGDDPARFLYIWQVKKGTIVIDTIGTGPVLDYPVTLPPDAYTLFLRVTDRETGVMWSAKTDLTVGTPYSRGILLAGEDEAGNAEVDIISMVTDTTILSNLLSQSGLPPLKGPVDFMFAYGGLPQYVKLWVLTTSGSYWLDRVTMKATTENVFGKQVYTTDNIDKNALNPVVIAPQIRDVKGANGSSSARAIATGEGNIFAAYFALSGGDYYANPVNRDKNNPAILLKAAPYIMYPIGSMGSFVWYDLDNQRFMNFSSMIAVANTPSVTLTDGPTDIFPWNQGNTGRKLVYAENTRNTDGGSTNGNTFSIMKDNSNQCFIYKFYANGANPGKRDFYTVLPIATDFDKADFYAFSSNRTVVFYAVANKLYAYDYNKGLEKIYEFPEIGTDAITMLKFDTQIDYLTNSLYIATYNAASRGTLQRYIVGSNPNVVELTPVEDSKWSGLIKITNMNWRAVN